LPRLAASMRVLVVEDYPLVRTAVSQGLREAGFAVDEAADGREGLWFAQSNRYDVIVLDLMLPRTDGLRILADLREREDAARVLILSAKDTVRDRVEGLRFGADDYLVKPFALEELLARVATLVRRKYNRTSDMIRVSDLEIDTLRKTACRRGESFTFTSREFELLRYLALRAGEVVSRTEIWESLYEFDSESSSNVVDVYIRYLRRKIERPEWPRLIHTRRGHGYLLGETP